MPGVSLPCVLGPGLCLYVTPELEEFSQAKSLLDSHMTFAHTQPAHQEAASNTWLLERMPRHLETELFSLDDRRGVITLGRKKGSDKVCSGQKVSRHHISLIRSQRGWGVIDVGSTFACIQQSGQGQKSKAAATTCSGGSTTTSRNRYYR